MVKSGLMVNPETRGKVNSLIKMYARDPKRFPGRIIVSQEDAVVELIRCFEEHNGEIKDPVTPASMIGNVKKITLIGAEGL